MAFSHSLTQHVAALQSVLDAAGDVDGLLQAITRCEGEAVARAAYAALVAQLPGTAKPATFKRLGGGEVGEWVGGMYRFYCYESSWRISPAAREGYALEG